MVPFSIIIVVSFSVIIYRFSETTAIDTLTIEAARPSNGVWYTISGVRLQGKPTVSGMYINNGKRIVIK